MDASGYKIFEPSADIDRQIWGRSTTDFLPGAIFTDTFSVAGNDFFRQQTKKRGLPSGSYRVRVYFNDDSWGHSFDIFSNWIKFEIP